MKQDIIKILIDLHENDSWDLAQIFAISLYNNPGGEIYLNAIQLFLERAIQLSQDELKKQALQKAFLQMKGLREQEQQERESEHYDDILNQLF